MITELEEIIEELISVLANTTSAGSYTPKSKVIDAFSVEVLLRELRILAKPVQYVVKYSYENRFVDTIFYRLNGICISVNGSDHEQAKLDCYRRINNSVELLALPPITMDQITFIEI